MTTTLALRSLLSEEGTYSGITVRAEFQAESGVIKRIVSGTLHKEELQIGNFSLEENGNMPITIHQDGLGNFAAVCAAVPLFIADVQTKINAL